MCELHFAEFNFGIGPVSFERSQKVFIHSVNPEHYSFIQSSLVELYFVFDPLTYPTELCWMRFLRRWASEASHPMAFTA